MGFFMHADLGRFEPFVSCGVLSGGVNEQVENVQPCFS